MNARTVALLVMLAGAGYLILYKRDELDAFVDNLTGGRNPFAPSTPQGSLTPQQRTPVPPQPSTAVKLIGASTATAAALLPSLLGGGAAAGGAGGAGGAAAGAGAGIGTGAAIAAAGIAAGAAVLAWGILKQGWFRGGDEGIHVNPARDEFFIEFNRKYGLPDHGDAGLGLGAGFARAAGDVGMPGYEANRMLIRINAANHMDEFEAALNDVTATFDAYSSLSNSPILPVWRQQQLAGAMVFANGQNKEQLIAATRALGHDYEDLVTDYAGIGF